MRSSATKTREDYEGGSGGSRAGARAASRPGRGLPATLADRLQSLSALDLSDVRVHRNSDKPAAVSAQAYTRGSDIYLGPGQERHIAHEAWHVVQQRQGRVAPTTRIGGAPVNDNPELEREADMFGSGGRGLRSFAATMPARRTGAGGRTR